MSAHVFANVCDNLEDAHWAKKTKIYVRNEASELLDWGRDALKTKGGFWLEYSNDWR